MHRIEIRRKNDPRETSVKEDFIILGARGITRVAVRDVYYLDDALTRRQARLIARELFCDPVVEELTIGPGRGFDIMFNPGVTDPREESIRKAIADLGMKAPAVKTATNYIITGRFNAQHRKKIEHLASLFLYNPLIQHIRYAHEGMSRHKRYRLHIVTVSLDQDLKKLSTEMGLSLSLAEMKTIKRYFARNNRPPTDVELETIAQTWSEHCGHKTFRGNILYRGKRIRNLLRNTIMRSTRRINSPRCLSVFHDNSGVIDFDDTYGVCFKVETHNHPSALEPYGGAATGIGGVIRDILGTGLGAKPIMNTDVFCFGPPDFPYRRLPEGILHPRRIIKGVYQGVRDYGNRMGIPTPSGAIYFDEEFLYNPLVYCGTVGLIRKDRIDKKPRRGDLIVLVGGKTGRDGIHGATFSSVELSSESEKSCVQIGNPIMEKRVLDCLLPVSDQGIVNCVTDCGGGGLSSSVGEMGRTLGAKVDLDKVPLKYQGLTPREIWISESQERMILSVSRKYLKKVLKAFQDENVEATVIGSFTGDKMLRLNYDRKNVCVLDMDFLHDGLPMPTKKAVDKTPPPKRIKVPLPRDHTETLLDLAGSLNSCSREWVIREYDHEVQGASVIKPLVGVDHDGPQDAVVLKPLLGGKKGIVVSCGINPSYGKLDAYNMAASAIEEALRNLTAVGGDTARAAMLDNFCFASPERPDVLADIVRSSQACHDAAIAFGVPFISGKDSLNNEWMDTKGRSHRIPPTLLISAMGVIDDVGSCITMDLKKNDSELFLIGDTYEELGGSEYCRYLRIQGGRVPGVDFKTAPLILKQLHTAIARGLILSCHDLSEGGLGLSLSEMAFSGNIGVDVDLDRVSYRGATRRPDFILFAESNSRFIVEVSAGDVHQVQQIFSGLPLRHIGCTKPLQNLIVRAGGNKLIDVPLFAIKTRWKRIT